MVGQTACQSGASIQYGASKVAPVPERRAQPGGQVGGRAGLVEAPRLAVSDQLGRRLQVGREQRLDQVEGPGGRDAGRYALLDQALRRIGDDERRRASPRHGGHQVRVRVDRVQQPAEVGDGVDAELGLRAVRGASREPHPDHPEPAKCSGERVVRSARR